MIHLHSPNGKAVELFLTALDCPRSLAIWILFRENEHDQLLELECSPFDYATPESFRDAYIATEYLSKSTFLTTSHDVKRRAMDKFWEAEAMCEKTNLYLSDPNRTINTGDLDVEAVFTIARRKIRRALGRFDPVEWFDTCGWGPGVTTLTKRDTSAENKFWIESGITRDLHDFVAPLFTQAYPHWNPSFTMVPANKIVTVPKSSKTDRTIAVEPGINLWFQKGLGNMIRRRLRRCGIDLNSQSRNQRLAKLGSLTGFLATVDFRSASDTISLSIVRELIPPVWFDVLDVCRSQYCSIDSSVHRYHKFSSMGNGFTFELESLIFWSLACAVSELHALDSRWISVYGDDVIIPSAIYDTYRDVCAVAGFTTNSKKSFSSYCPFRESCGSHYYDGVDCKPFYHKVDICSKGHPYQFYRHFNSIRRLANRIMGNYGCDARFAECWKFGELLAMLHYKRVCRISDGYGDGGFISNFDEAVPDKARHGIEGYVTWHTQSVPKPFVADHHGVYLARIWKGSPDRLLGNEYSIRGRTRSRTSRLLVRQWVDLGPWV